jgi:hypothetical protein
MSYIAGPWSMRERYIRILDSTVTAVATTEPHNDIARWSLTFEAYLTPWSSDRAGVEKLQRKIEGDTQ